MKRRRPNEKPIKAYLYWPIRKKKLRNFISPSEKWRKNSMWPPPSSAFGNRNLTSSAPKKIATAIGNSPKKTLTVCVSFTIWRKKRGLPCRASKKYCEATNKSFSQKSARIFDGTQRASGLKRKIRQCPFSQLIFCFASRLPTSAYLFRLS